MKTALRTVLRLLVIALMVFCAYGFLATFEPLPAQVQWTWRAIYGLAAGGCVWLLVRLTKPARRRSEE